LGLGSQRDFNAPLFAESTAWESATPFIATRYPKLRGQKRDRPEVYATPQVFAAHVLRQELMRLTTHDSPLTTIELLDGIGPRRLRCIQFQRFRRKHGDDGGRRSSAAFRVTFAQPVRGPLCLGHSAHFGMGLFLPI
jgi:CRISPR-associated protein Csb2